MDREHMTPRLGAQLETSGGRRGAVLLMAGLWLCVGSAATKAEESKELRVFNWSDYIGQTTVEDFQDETDIVKPMAVAPGRRWDALGTDLRASGFPAVLE